MRLSKAQRFLFITLIIILPVLLSACSTARVGPIDQPEGQSPLDTPAVTNQLELPGPVGEEGSLEGQDPLIVAEEIIVLLLLIATIVGILARQLRVPYTVGLVLIGLLLTLSPEVDINVRPTLILGLLVPPLVFEGAFHLNIQDLRRNLGIILSLAVPGVIITMLLVGGLVSWGTGLPLSITFVFGALVAAIDPVAVIALFRTMGVPKRLQVIMEGESLLNDGTAIVLFGLVTSLALKSTEFNLVNSVIDFIRISAGGLLVGIILGILISQMILRIDDYLLETTLTSILAFGSYLIAEHIFHVSGVLAVVAAGLINGNIGPRGMSPTTRIVVFNFWEYAGFLANSFIFLLIGLQINLNQLIQFWPRISIAIIAVLISRAVTIYGLSWIWKDIPSRWQHVLNWGGLRGAISLALALGLPIALGPDRNDLQAMAFGVVLFTLVVQGFTMRPLVRRLRLVERSPSQVEYERRHARAVAVRSAYDHLKRMSENGLISEHTWQTLSPILEQHSQTLVDAVRDVISMDPSVEAEELDTARRESLRAQRSTLTGLLKDGVISEETYSQLATEIDTALAGGTTSWPEMIRQESQRQNPVGRLMTAVIQDQDFENALSVLTKLGISVTHLPTVGGFLGRRNVTLIIGYAQGQEESVVRALNNSCRRRVEYIAAPLEGSPLPFPSPMPVTVGGATIFTFEVEDYREF